MTFKDIQDIANKFPSPLNALVYNEDGEHIALVIVSNNKIIVMWTQKNSTEARCDITFNDNEDVKIDRLDGGINFTHKNKNSDFNTVVMLVPMLGKYSNN